MNASSNMAVPSGDVLVRKIKPPDGIHPLIGYCKVGRIYTVGDRKAKEMVNGGEFQYVNAADDPRPPERSATDMAVDRDSSGVQTPIED